MSESFQEFCKRILPAVQVGAEGKKIDFFSNSEDRWVVDEGYGFWLNTQYRIAEPKATPLPITPEMWAMIDPKYQWAFLSHDGQSVVCEKEPRWDAGKGLLPDNWLVYGYCSKLPLNINTAGIIPELSLTKRPEQVKVKDSQELKVNVKSFKKAAEMLKEFDEQHELDKKSELEECKSQATHYMHDKYSGRLLYRKHCGAWYVLHEISVLWLAVLITDESKLIEIK